MKLQQRPSPIAFGRRPKSSQELGKQTPARMQHNEYVIIDVCFEDYGGVHNPLFFI